MSHEWLIGLIDMESFYASVEVATRSEYAYGRMLEDNITDPPLAVVGDPRRRSGIVLAASPTAKAAGVSTAMRLGEALEKCPDLLCAPARMQLYIDTSVRIHETVRSMFPKFETFSVDECFFAFQAGSLLFPDPIETASTIRARIWDQFRVRSRVGIAPNKWGAKMANKFAKKVPGGVVWWKSDEFLNHLHKLDVTDMWGLRRRAETLVMEFGCRTIGDVAKLPVGRLRTRFGVWGDVIHRWSNGIDYGDLNSDTLNVPHQGYSNRTTLPKDFYKREEIAVVILELLDQVCSRARQTNQKGRRIGLGVTYARMEGGFHRAKTLPISTNQSEQLYPTLLELLDKHWDTNHGIRAVSVSLDMLGYEDGGIQLDLFEDVPKRRALWETVDNLRSDFGQTSILRASSLLPAGQMRDRSTKIGGHTA